MEIDHTRDLMKTPMTVSKDHDSTIATERISTGRDIQINGIEIHMVDHLDLPVIFQIEMDQEISQTDIGRAIFQIDLRELIHLLAIDKDDNMTTISPDNIEISLVVMRKIGDPDHFLVAMRKIGDLDQTGDLDQRESSTVGIIEWTVTMRVTVLC